MGEIKKQYLIAAVCAAVILCIAVTKCRSHSPEGSDEKGEQQTSAGQTASEQEPVFHAEEWSNAPAYTDSTQLEAYLQQCYDKGMEEIHVISSIQPPGSGMFSCSTGMLSTYCISWKVGYVYYTAYTVEYAMGSKIINAVKSEDMTTLSDTELKVYVKAMDFIEELPAEMSLLDKETAIHDFICKNTVYYSEESSTAAADFRTAEGVLMNGRGNCMGYSDAFLLLCGLAGIEVQTDSSNEMCHMWNVVELDGKYYLVDVTWDDQDNGTFTHQYLNAGRDRMDAYTIHEDSVSEMIVRYSDEHYRGG